MCNGMHLCLLSLSTTKCFDGMHFLCLFKESVERRMNAVGQPIVTDKCEKHLP